jgi:lipoprotein-anchoring transpeptidase ErfK/SrfK
MKPALATLACLLTAGALAQAAPATAGARRIAPGQELVTLLSNHAIHRKPSNNSRPVGIVNDRRPITGERTVLPVLAQRVNRNGRFWLRVRLPGRTVQGTPPPPTGWISASKTQLSTTPWHILVNLGARRVTIYRDGRPVHKYQAIVGKPSTPTPVGQYFVEEDIQLPANAAGAPYALATSDRSDVYQEFDGGPGQIALHGIENLGGQFGTAESHGCIRLANNVITWLAARIAPGVPVTIIN